MKRTYTGITALAASSIALVAIITALLVRPNAIGTTRTTPAAWSASDIVITANPVDLATIGRISKFRGCAGHWYAGTNIDGETEPSSSMKHYFVPKQASQGTTGTVPVYAPFDGTIARIDPTDIWRGRQFIIQQRPFRGWFFGFTHITMNAGLVEGALVNAGDLLGYANVPAGTDFDVFLQASPTSGARNFVSDAGLHTRLDSIFSHLAPKIKAAYAAAGVTPATMVIPKSTREASPCSCAPGTVGTENTTACTFNTDQPLSENWVTLP